jgi:hypothetical protein
MSGSWEVVMGWLGLSDLILDKQSVFRSLKPGKVFDRVFSHFEIRIGFVQNLNEKSIVCTR